MATVLLKWTKGEVQNVIHFSQAKGIHPTGIIHEMEEFRSLWSRTIEVPCKKKIQDNKPGTGDNNFSDMHSVILVNFIPL
jgi:hypothetical protein